MSKVMLVNVTHVEESRVAILRDGVLTAYEIDTTNRSNIIGNIYNVVVEDVLDSIGASFVRLGSDLKGFLPLDEVNFRLLPSRGDGRGRGKITQHLHHAQRLMAQVVRAPFSGKPPTVTTYFSLPGRYLVLMPGVDSSGISRKIGDLKQRDRLKKIVDELNPPEGFGLIVRTAGFGQTKTELQRDMRYLLRLWESIQRASRATEFPGLVYQERDLVIRTIRDYFTPDIGEVWIDSQETYERALAFVRDVMPSKAKTLRLYTGQRPLFNKFNLEEQIESIYKRRVTLPSGGEIVIDGTEALTAIDVNSARSTRKGDVEETALQTNLEASTEVARQLRLRDLGGLVVIDFIDMLSPRNRTEIEKTLREAMKTDKARYDITRISKLGLVELARQRIKGEKMSASYTTCPTCEGHGLVKNVEPAALAALRKLQTRALHSDLGRINLLLPAEVAHWVLNHKRADLLEIEQRHDVHVRVEPRPDLLRHQCEFETFPRERAEEPPARVGPDRPVPAVPPDPKDLPEAAEETMPPAPEAKPGADEAREAGGPTSTPRKRRRRRKRTETPSEVGGPEQAAHGRETKEADTSDPAGEPKRRRRRRRRRGRGGRTEDQGQPDQAPAATGATKMAGQSEEPGIPREVKKDELLPAATGTADRIGSSPGRRSRKKNGKGEPKRLPTITAGGDSRSEHVEPSETPVPAAQED